MSDQNGFDEEDNRRRITAPYTSKHPIPTIQKYRDHRAELDEKREAREQAQEAEDADGTGSKFKRAAGAVKQIFKSEDKPKGGTKEPYPTENRNIQDGDTGPQDHKPQSTPNGTSSSTQQASEPANSESSKTQQPSQDDGNVKQSGTESTVTSRDPRQKRKDMKKMDRDTGGRQVTDPVTHLPIIIKDSTDQDIKRAPENEAAPGELTKTQTGVSGASKSDQDLQQEREEMQQGYEGMKKMFPPPDFDDTKAEIMRVNRVAFVVGFGSFGILSLLAIAIPSLFAERYRPQGTRSWWSGALPQFLFCTLFLLAGGALLYAIQGWLSKKIKEIWDDEVWDSARQQENKSHEDAKLPESVAWLNSLLASIWPLINPDLFTSLADTLEDVMQASLPKLVRMVSVDDLGQGSEAFRILGIRWLPTGAASQTVDEDGNLKSPEKSQHEDNDRIAPDKGQVSDDDDEDQKDDTGKQKSDKDQEKSKEDEQENEAMREGLEAEQGDFVNMEMAFAYRARTSGKSLKAKARNAHLYLKFYLPGSIAVPVWVELRGIIGTMRLRLQLTPDPPFFSLCTLTFLGQPKADLSCVPLSKHSLNIMDVPLISSFVQSAIDAALAEYVAPKSLTLDLKDMLMGDDFKKDTVSRGVVAVFVKSATGFKEGDGGFGPMQGSSDSYVTVSWGKFGKPMSSTRIIVDEQKPRWDEWSYILVGPEELNADEMLRLQLWDSDKHTADDDLGRVEVSLKEIMNSSDTKNRICDREDRFTNQDPDEKAPGTISWRVGYFAKTSLTDEQLAKQTEDKDIKSKEDLKRKVSEIAERKLREATIKDESKELQQQKTQDYKEHEDALTISSPPDEHFPSGILSIQIHNITGLEVERLQKRSGRSADADGDKEDAGEGAKEDDLPSSFCVIILNHQKIYRTRTKPKNAKPFFNAGTEKFVRDWRTSEVLIAFRDAREGESDALLGVVYLPLAKLFHKRSQINDTFPIAGGIGFGRARISLVWRSTELRMPDELRGWDYGTLEVKAPIKVKDQLPNDLTKLRIKLTSNIARAKMHSQSSKKDSSNSEAVAEWHPKHSPGSSVFLACRRRYACPVILEWRKSTLGPDSTAAFAVFWLKDLPDEDEKTITLKVWKGSKDAFKRARTCDAFEEWVNGKELQQPAKSTSKSDSADTKSNGTTEEPENDKKSRDAEVVGTITLTLKFWRGLSGWHKKWAEKSSHGSGSADVMGVMEALDVVGDIEGDGQEPGDDGQESESDSDQDGPPEDDSLSVKEAIKHPIRATKDAATSLAKSHNSDDDPSRGPLNQLRDYKDHAGALHRQHRGIMQWRGARKLDFMIKEAKGVKGMLERKMTHGQEGKEAGIETEV